MLLIKILNVLLDLKTAKSCCQTKDRVIADWFTTMKNQPVSVKCQNLREQERHINSHHYSVLSVRCSK